MSKPNALLAITLMFAAIVGGCAGAKADQTLFGGAGTPKPDRIIVETFAVTADEVTLDKGVAATVYRDMQGRSLTQDEILVGRAVAAKLTEKLVALLNKDGIPAVAAGSGVQPTPTSVILKGHFVSINEGDQTERVWIGFGMGGSKLRTKVQFFQNGKLIAQAETTTDAGLKPGMIVGLATGTAAGTAAPIVVGGVMTGFSETMMATVEADAARTANAIAQKVRERYVERGWLAK